MGKQQWPQYGTARYRRARAAILAGGPSCHWCKVAPATTADHEPPLVEVGYWHWDLVPACGPCNFGRRSSRPAPLDASSSRVW